MDKDLARLKLIAKVLAVSIAILLGALIALVIYRLDKPTSSKTINLGWKNNNLNIKR